jgi:hypothetical protein
MKVAIIGGGVAGVSTALYLGELGVDVTLFEKESSLVSGPPFCHLHAGGNLYREISDKQCITLLKQSIDFLHFYPFVVDHRPTVIALPTTDKSTPKELLPRLKLLQKEYQKLIDKNIKNRVLGDSKEYYKLYEREKLQHLKDRDIVQTPKTSDEWMIAVAKNLDFDKVQFPLILVQEYGLNLFRLASGATLALKDMKNVKLKTDTTVTDIKNINSLWQLTYDENQKDSFDYLINAAGFRTGKIDDMLQAPCKCLVEFKAAYISKCENYIDTPFPEIIFHGERGTPQGMGQFTPYPDGYFQLHGMTKDITLYEDGLVASTKFSCQPKLPQDFIQKIENSWSKDEINKRTNMAIKHLSRFIPSFSKATVASKPLFGAQQIPGDDPTLRVAEVSFPLDNYARCEIVKVSSVIDMIKAILANIDIEDEIKEFNYLKNLKEDKIKKYAQELCKQRGYPTSLANRNVPAT